MNKENILAEIMSFIEKGDKTIESIDSFILETKHQKYGGQGNKELFERALDVEKEYRGYLADICTAIKGYDLNKIEESTFKPKHIEEIRGGVSEIKGYINIPNTNNIFENVKRLIIATEEKLRKVAGKNNIKSDGPFREIKDNDTIYSFRIKKRPFTFDKPTLQYWLIKYMVTGYNENLYYHKDAISYVKENFPKWTGRLSSILQNINDNNRDIKFKLIEVSKKGKTFKFNDELFR